MTTITDLETEAREAALTNGVSEKQFNFVLKLARERIFSVWGTSPDERVATGLQLFVSGTIQRRNASTLIDGLLSREYDHGDAEQLKPGVYEKDGVTYVVKPNKAKTNVYAKRLIEISGDRLTEVNTVVKFDFVYAPGMIHQLTAEDQMPLDRAKELMIRYGKCINCKRPLKAATSVERGIGPVCIKAFR